MIKLPKKHLAALYEKPGKINVREVPLSYPAQDFCLIKVEGCGICGSDLHTYRGNSLRPTFADWVKLGYADGHEYCGTVVAIGERVEKIKLGMRVVAECATHCGKCTFCKRGLYNLCFNRKCLVWQGHGGFSEYAMAPEHALFQIPESMDPLDAVMVEPSACVLRAVNRSDIKAGENLLVVGGGTIGLLCAYIAQEMFNCDTAIVCKYNHQKEVACSLGIGKVYMPGETDEETADVVIDAVGLSESFNESLKAVNRAGTIVIIGSPISRRTVKLGYIVGKELTVKGALIYAFESSKKDFQVAIDLINKGKFYPKKLIFHQFSLAEITEAFKTALNKESGAIKVIIKYF